MRVSIAINNYNYSKYIIECVNSVLNQTYKDIEVIVVDDGSTDDSLELLTFHYSKNKKINIISKKNAGQLSAFNEITSYISGEIVCFLDSDDLYKENYIEKIVEIYKLNTDIDFVFSALERIYNDGRSEIVKRMQSSQSVGFSVLGCLIYKDWVGSETSAVSMRASLVNNILPIPFESDWITRADDCLIWSSSIAGAKKYYFVEPLVVYRVHDGNGSFNTDPDSDYLLNYKRQKAMYKLFTYFTKKYEFNHEIIFGKNITLNTVYFAILEYKSRNCKKVKTLKKYIRIIYNSDMPFFRKLKLISRLIKIYFQF